MHWAHHSTVHCSHKAGGSAVHTGPEEIPSKKAFNDKTSFQNFYHPFMDDPPTPAAVLSSSLKKINLVLRTFFFAWQCFRTSVSDTGRCCSQGQCQDAGAWPLQWDNSSQQQPTAPPQHQQRQSPEGQQPGNMWRTAAVVRLESGFSKILDRGR